MQNRHEVSHEQHSYRYRKGQKSVFERRHLRLIVHSSLPLHAVEAALMSYYTRRSPTHHQVSASVTQEQGASGSSRSKDLIGRDRGNRSVKGNMMRWPGRNKGLAKHDRK